LKIEIVVIGKLKEYIRPAVKEYIKMLSSFAEIKLTQIKHAKGYKDFDKSLKKEAEGIISQLKESDYVILLDQSGRSCDSISFANHFHQLIQINSSIVFVIGGPFGVDESLKKRANELLSLSDLTFTHQLAVVILLEQLFRAFKIINNQKYHY
jgi:23S rRNA (pseudouridine1915-N3)-methyltransferase